MSSGTSTKTRFARQRCHRGCDRLFYCGRPQRHRKCTCLETARVEQVTNETIETITLGVDGRMNLGQLVAAPFDVGLQQARHVGLDGGERRAQIVRHRLQQRGAQRIDVLERFGASGLRGQGAGVDGHRDLVGDGTQGLVIVGCERAAADHEHMPVARVVGLERHADAVLGSGRNRETRRRQRRPTRTLTDEHRNRLELERRTNVVHQSRQRIVGRDEVRGRATPSAAT